MSRGSAGGGGLLFLFLLFAPLFYSYLFFYLFFLSFFLVQFWSGTVSEPDSVVGIDWWDRAVDYSAGARIKDGISEQPRNRCEVVLLQLVRCSWRNGCAERLAVGRRGVVRACVSVPRLEARVIRADSKTDYMEVLPVHGRLHPPC